MAKKHVIHSSEMKIDDWVVDREDIMWGDSHCICDDCKSKDCKHCSDFYNRCSELNSEYLDDCIRNLDIPLGNSVIAFAELGLWNGKKSGYKILKNNVNAIFSISEDYNEYYVDAWNVRAKCVHHDGTNSILYRKLKDNVSVEQIEEILYNNGYKLSPQQMSKYTESLRPYVADFYGW